MANSLLVQTATDSLDLSEKHLDYPRAFLFTEAKPQSMVMSLLNWSNSYFVTCEESECLIENMKLSPL